MALLVLKFGGTSVATPERIRHVAERIARERHAGHDLVVVVSAMGHTTDELMTLAARVSPDARRRHLRELDMLLSAGERIAMSLLAMAIRDAGVEALSFTGSQAAIITDDVHQMARIEEVRADRVREELSRGCVVIVAGFQGVSRRREVTTLGRGGSDTTAVALAAALGAERCDVYTDVDGVFTADPRVVPGARKIERIGYAEMLELAQSGARVMHARAVELGQRFRVPIRVLSSFADEPVGTLIMEVDRKMEGLVLTALAADSGYAAVLLRGLAADMRSTAATLSGLASAGVSVDMVSQLDRVDGRRDLMVTVRESVLEEALGVCQAVAGELGGEEVESKGGLARLTIVGSGMTERPGVYATAFEALLAADVPVHALSTSAISISLLVDAAAQERAQQRLHDAFQLAEVPA
ncbi:MAG: aspartate kinase [Longimicrobiales bacterium]